MPGDHADPSVVKIGNEYWASATTSNWAPSYPLLMSTDLLHWELKGHVFPKLPAWADYYFWAPEISYDNGKVYVYYAAHKRNGNLCLGVASAEKPEGPYKDHGTLMCEEVGSIDAFPMRDSNGKLYMIWKEDGNSVGKPTPIWAMEMNEERTALLGEKKELFRNDAAWEANLVEGVSMMRHGEYIYAFYAGAGCCGRDCSYAMGVARAKNLFGPWEKFENNPLFKSGEIWKCPGHGTPVEKDGKYFMLYHAYHAQDNVYAGRQGVLKEFRFTPEGWIELVEDEVVEPKVPARLQDDFSGRLISPQWQWSVFETPVTKINKAKLELQAMPSKSGVFVGQKILTANYQSRVTLFQKESTAEGGLGIVGDEKNLIALTVKNGKARLWKIQEDKEEVIAERSVPESAKLQLKVEARNGKDFTFYYSTNGETFQKVNDNAADGFFLPPWDRALRIVLISKGETQTKAVFDDFVLEN